MTTAVQDHTEQGAPPVFGLAEAAERLGMTKASVQTLRGRDNITRRDPAATHKRTLFPEADWLISGNPMWRPETIEAYGRQTGRITS